jgi:phage terminase large subunit
MPPGLSVEQAEELRLHCLANPNFFVKEILGANPWRKQRDIVDAVFKYRNVAVKTCNSVGKSYIAARIVVTYLILHPDSIVVTTAPTWNQVVNILWREIGSAVKQAERNGYKLTDAETTQAGLNIDTKWYAIGRSTSTPDNMMGFHADHLLVVVDEAGGVDDPIFQGVKAITTNVNNKVLLIGNPTTPGGVFWQSFQKGSMYKQFTISAFDTPNMIANGIRDTEDLKRAFKLPERVKTDEDALEYYDYLDQEVFKFPFRELITPRTIFERLSDWGEDSDAWQSLVLGEFPTQAAQSLIPTHLLTMAMQMYGTDDETGKSYAQMSGWNIPIGAPEYGLDMARFGGDNTVLTPRQGGWVEKQIAWNHVDLVVSANKILGLENFQAYGPLLNPLDHNVRLNIDDTGNGGGTTDKLRELSRHSMQGGMPAHQYEIVEYNFSRGPSNPDKFADITSELYWNLRQQFFDKKIALHYDKTLFDELVDRRWSTLPNKKIKVETKDEYKKRKKTTKSPDRSDSLALAFAGPIRQAKPNKSQEQIEAEEYIDDNLSTVTGGLSERY